MTYSADHDSPQLVATRHVIAVTNGNRLAASTDGGHRWTRIHLAGPDARDHAMIDDIAVYRHRLLALVTTSTNRSQTERVYTGSAAGRRLTDERRLAISGDFVYGALSTAGGVQVALGAGNEYLRSWYSRDASAFRRAPLPCPAVDTPLLAGVHGGRDVALCAAGESEVGPGTTTIQVSTSSGLGQRFTAAHAPIDAPNPLDFAAASGTTVAVGAAPGLAASFDAGRTYAAKVTTGEGSSWQSMDFLSRAVGVAVDDTVTSRLAPTGHLYRTTDAGHHWTALTL